MKTQLRTGIIGVGAVVREIYQYLYFRSQYSELLDIRAVADPNEEYRNWFCDLAGIPADRRFADYREMLQKVELDAVQVNTPDHLHCAPTVAALEAGLDVIVPKPAAATAAKSSTPKPKTTITAASPAYLATGSGQCMKKIEKNK